MKTLTCLLQSTCMATTDANKKHTAVIPHGLQLTNWNSGVNFKLILSLEI